MALKPTSPSGTWASSFKVLWHPVENLHRPTVVGARPGLLRADNHQGVVCVEFLHSLEALLKVRANECPNWSYSCEHRLGALFTCVHVISCKLLLWVGLQGGLTECDCSCCRRNWRSLRVAGTRPRPWRPKDDTDYRPSVNIACFFGHDSPGEKHVKCAEACARVGNLLAIFDGKQIYLSVSMHHKNPNDKLMTCIEKKVKLTGSIVEKAGLRGIMIEKVEAAE